MKKAPGDEQMTDSNFMIQERLPEAIKRELTSETYIEDTIGMSRAKVFMFPDKVLKIQPDAPWADREIEMLKWLNGKLPVPKVIVHEKYDGITYLLMTRISGKMSCEEVFLQNPNILIDRLAEAMQMLWEIDVASCPVVRDTDTELKEARYRIDNNLVDMDNVEPETFGAGGFKNPGDLYDWLVQNKPSCDFVFSHGDFCLPNIFLSDTGISGFIDLGDAGAGDRYRDIALCYRSLKHNTNGTFGGAKYEVNPDRLFDALGIKPDMDKIRWYLLLDELF